MNETTHGKFPQQSIKRNLTVGRWVKPGN